MAMRWLTREWQAGELPETERESRWETYLEHRDTTAIHLPGALHRLAAAESEGSLTLHQAIPEWWALEPDRTLTLALITGDDGHPTGGVPQRVILQYAGNLDLDGTTAEDLETWLSRPGARLLYDEIDVLPGRRYEQRFLLGPGGELTVRFDTVALMSAPTTVAERDAVVDRRSQPEGAAAPAPAAPAGPAIPAAESHTPPPAPAATQVVQEPPEGAPTPPPSADLVAQEPPAPKRSLRDTLLSWLPGVRGSGPRT